MTQISTYLENLLNLAQSYSPEEPFTDATIDAFQNNPRHRFVKRYLRGEETIEVTADNLHQHLPLIYSDSVISLFTDEERGVYSTISQPSLVLHMLELLKIKPGCNVLEVGAGSGWNAAMMGSIVGKEGKVVSIEIIPEMAKNAKAAISDLGIENVDIIGADGGNGYLPSAPYDRVVFTAGTYDLPRAFHEQVKVGGYLLAVIKVEGGGDQMFLLERKTDYFESLFSLPCQFVPMTGKYVLSSAEPISLSSLANWNTLKAQEVDRSLCWWGGNEQNLIWVTLGLRSFLSISEPMFRVFKEENSGSSNPQYWFFGLLDQESNGLVIARGENLFTYGNIEIKKKLMKTIHNWVELGMPSLASMDLRIYPIEADLESGLHQWIVRRADSQFLWKLRRHSG